MAAGCQNQTICDLVTGDLSLEWGVVPRTVCLAWWKQLVWQIQLSPSGSELSWASGSWSLGVRAGSAPDDPEGVGEGHAVPSDTFQEMWLSGCGPL
jgi:hypothetical protein